MKITIKKNECIKGILIYLMMIAVVKYVFRIIGFEKFDTAISYLNVFLLSILIVFHILKNRIKLTYELFVSTIILLSSFLLTFLSRGLISGLLAVGINIFLLFTVVVLDSMDVDENTFLDFCKTVVFFAMIVIAISVIRDKPFSQLVSLKNAYRFEFFGIWNSKNQFGRFLFLGMVCNFFIIRYNGIHRIKQVKYYFSYFVIILCIVLSFSRAALLSTIVFLSVYYLITNRIHFKRNIIIITGVLISFFVIYSIPVIKIFIKSLVIRTETATIDNRSVLWKIGMEYFKTHPFVGAGEYSVAGILGEKGSVLTEFHNAYVNRLVVSGLLVFLLYAFLYAKRFFVAFLVVRENQYSYISISVLMALLIYMFFESFELYTFSLDAFIAAAFTYLIPRVRTLSYER